MYDIMSYQINISRNDKFVTFTLSGRLLAAATWEMGKADVFDAKTQCSGITYEI